MKVREAAKWGLRLSGYRLVRVRPRDVDLRRKLIDAAPSISSLDDSSYYRAGAWRYTAPLETMVSRPCFRFGPAWHPLTEAMREVINEPGTRYADSILNHFYDRFQPRTVAEAKLLSPGRARGYVDQIEAATLFEPWLLREPPFDDPESPHCRPAGSPLFGPVSKDVGEREHRRLIGILDSVRRFGYRPDLFPGGRIGVIVLRHEGEERYLVVHGQHRAAALSALGATSLEVGLQPGMPPIVDSRHVHRWPHVVLGRLSSGSALRIFEQYFTDVGTSWARAVGLRSQEEASDATSFSRHRPAF